jgi:hypothetical protein
MTRTATQGLLMVGGFIVLLLVSAALFIKLDGKGLRGAAIGAALGLINLAVGSLLTRRALRHGMKSAMGALFGGFAARLVLLVVLTLVFERTAAVDPAAFAFTFLVFFFVYVGVELLMVDRSGIRRTA